MIDNTFHPFSERKVSMSRSVLLIALVVAVGCGKAPQSPTPVGKAADQPVSQPVQVPFQQVTITDEHGTRTVTVPADTPFLPPPAPVLPDGTTIAPVPVPLPAGPVLPAVPKKQLPRPYQGEPIPITPEHAPLPREKKT
jgi:hypothetical protein